MVWPDQPDRVENATGLCARGPATGVAGLSYRGGTAWPILTAGARCWILGPNGVARRRAKGFSLGMSRRLGTVSALLGGIAAHAT